MSWVVFQANHKNAAGVNSVCEQGEWEQMLALRPHFYTLVQGGFVSEVAAEKAARPPDQPKIRPKPRW